MVKKLILIFSLFVGLSACGLEKYPGGDLPTQSRLNAIQTGDTKDKVLRILGTPASENPPLKDGTSFLIYAQNMKESRVFLNPTEVSRDIYIYIFNANDILTEQKHLTLADNKNIPFENDITPAGGKQLSIIEQIVNNFGRYNAGSQDSSVRR